MIDNLTRFKNLLILFFPLSIVIGPAVSEGTIILICIIFLIITYKNNLWKKYYANTFFIFFWIWCTYLIIRSSVSFDPILSLKSSLFYFRFGIFSLAIWHLLEEESKFKNLFFWSYAFIFLFVIFDSYLQYFTGYDLFGFYYDQTKGLIRLSGPFDNRLALGIYLSRMFPLLIALFALNYSQKKYFNISFIILSILTGGIIFLSGERTAFGYFIVIMFLVFIFIKKLRKLGVIVFISSLLIISLIVTLDKNIKFRMFEQTLQQIQSDDGKLHFISETHQSFLVTSISIFKDNKFFGIGNKLYRKACLDERYVYKDSCSTHPHNYYLQLLSETGLIGTIPIVLIFLLANLNLIKLNFLKKDSNENFNLNMEYQQKLINYKSLLLIALIINLWPFFPSLGFFNNWSSAMMFLPVGFIIHSFSRKL
tara:strand:+ start:10437 stop:11705 length:1269 start_codon:yes stop_codon:yes gene_type:complete